MLESDEQELETKLQGTTRGSRRAGADLHGILFGADGMRAGWGLLAFVLTFSAIYMALGSVMAALFRGTLHSPALISPGFVLRGEGVAVAAVLGATWVVARLEGRSFTSFGLDTKRWRARALWGAALGAGLLAVLIGALAVSGFLVFESRALRGAAAVAYGAEWLVAFTLVALYEEMLFRGYLQLTLARGLAGLYRLMGVRWAEGFGFWTAAFVLSFGFGAVHSQNTGESPVGLFAAGFIGLIFCLSLWRSGSLWWAIGFHAAWDWAESYLFGVYDSGTLAQGRLFQTHSQGGLLLSGGLTGPEGSLLVLPTLLVMALAILITLPGRAAAQTDQSLKGTVGAGI